MKRTMKTLLLAGAAIALAIPFVIPNSADATITGSSHDFSGQSWTGLNGEICKPCHTPHNADQTVTNAPLWNHTVTTATYTLYTGSGTLNATMGQPSGVSKLCLSCHDGTVALDSFGGATGGTNITGNALLGTDLSNDHPVSFTYDTALSTADGELFDPATTNSGVVNGSSTIAADMLFGGQMECASCHDVHNTAVVAGRYMLRKSMTGSALCLTCHNK